MSLRIREEPNPGRLVLLVGTVGLFAAVISCKPAAAPAQEKSDLFRVGMIATLFDEKDEKQVLAQMEPFADSIKKRTGVAGEFVMVQDAETMGRMLKDGRLHLGILHGVEYGWLKAACPDCKPLLIAINETPTLTAHVLVPKESPAKTIEDLKGKKLILPRRTLNHTRLYLERLVGGEIEKHFELSKSSANAEEAIEAVIEGKADCTAVGNVALETYRQRKPGRFNRLRVLCESPPFPAAVILRRPGTGRAADVEKFRASLLTSDQTVEGRQTLNLWRLTAFQEVPKDYERQVEEIVKKYPAR